MIARRTLTALVGTAVAGLVVTTLAVPALAETTVTVSGDLTEDNSELDGGTFSRSNVIGPTVTISMQVDVSSLNPSTEEDFNVVGDLVFREDGEEDLACTDSGGSAKCGISVGETKTFVIDTTANGSQVTLEWSQPEAEYPPIVPGFTVTYADTPPAPDSGGTGSAGTAPASVLLQALDLFGGDWMPADESGLVGWEKTVPVNTWQALPESGDVVGVGENEGKVFLGVATTPDFPVAIAQRQVENGWGAYQAFDADGELASVFIPAGGSMFVWTQPRLYAVWGPASS